MPSISVAELRQHLAARTPARVYVLTGPDEREKSALATEIADLVDPELRAFNVERFYGADASAMDVSEAARTLPMMGDRRVVVVMQAERLLNGKRKGGGEDEGDDLDAGGGGDTQPLVDYLAKPGDTTVLVFVLSPAEAPLQGRGHDLLPLNGSLKITKALAKHATSVAVGEFGSEREVLRWLEARARAAGLAVEPAAVQRRVLLAALRAAGVRHPGLDEVEALRGLSESASSARDLPGGVRANRIGAAVVLSVEGLAHDVGGTAYRYSLRVPGEVRVPEAAAVVTAVSRGGGSAPRAVADLEVDVDGDVLGPAVGVRNWQAGDLIRPVGLGGRKKLQDVFVDGKLPRLERRRLPLVVDAEDRVLWVPGLALDERARVTSGTKAVVTLRLTRLQVGGPE
jgi:tRNA(Ile)-lysidine synthetase-like protein